VPAKPQESAMGEGSPEADQALHKVSAGEAAWQEEQVCGQPATFFLDTPKTIAFRIKSKQAISTLKEVSTMLSICATIFAYFVSAFVGFYLTGMADASSAFALIGAAFVFAFTFNAEKTTTDRLENPEPIKVALKLSKTYGEVKDTVRTCIEPQYAWRLTSERTDKGEMHFMSSFQSLADKRLTKYVTLDIYIATSIDRRITVTLRYAVFCESLARTDCYLLIHNTTCRIKERLLRVEQAFNNMKIG
jgi:hypothetical protein